jgi:hypothetical protein
MKHTDKETITRIPLFMTTNIDLWTWKEDAEKQPLQQRYKEFEIKHRIQNEIDSPYTIPQPKETITHNQIVGLIYKYGEEIRQNQRNRNKQNSIKRLHSNTVRKHEHIPNKLQHNKRYTTTNNNNRN